MAELLGPDGASRAVHLRPGVSAHGRTATIYTDADATTLAEILTYDGTGTPGAAVTGSQVVVNADSELPLFWFPDGVDTLYATVAGRAGVKRLYADLDARLDTVAGMTQAAAVADAAALTAVAAAGATPTDDEFDALLADVTELRTQLNALLGSLRTAGVIDT